MQLDLFDWARDQVALTDVGGKCSYCHEEDQWLVKWTGISATDRYHYTESIEVECQAPRYDPDDLLFVEICKNTKTVEIEHEP